MSLSQIQSWWQRVRATQADLNARFPEGVMWVQPTNDPQRNTYGGLAVQVSTETAAKMIVNGHATEATEGDIAKAQEQAKENLMLSQAQELRNNGAVKVILGRVPVAPARK